MAREGIGEGIGDVHQNISQQKNWVMEEPCIEYGKTVHRKFHGVNKDAKNAKGLRQD